MHAILSRLWADDSGSVLTTEYLILGTLVSIGAGAGLNAVNVAVNRQAEQFSAAVVAINPSYSVATQQTNAAIKAGSSFQVRIDATP